MLDNQSLSQRRIHAIYESKNGGCRLFESERGEIFRLPKDSEYSPKIYFEKITLSKYPDSNGIYEGFLPDKKKIPPRIV